MMPYTGRIRSQQVDISNKVLITLRQITRGIDLHSQSLIKRYGLTGPQLLVLKELSTQREITPSELARRLSISQATITSMIDRLAVKGYIERVRDKQDKRKVRLELKGKGLEIIEQDPSLLQEEFVEEFTNLRSWEQTQILSSLQRIAEMMNVQHVKADPYLTPANDMHP
jgi:DNA-binding MarR family transcriptional regulator